VDEELAKVGVTALADAHQSCLAAGRVLSWNKAHEGRKLPALAKSGSVADGSNDGGGDQGTDPRDRAQAMAGRIGGGDLFDLKVGCPDLLVQALPLRPEVGDEVAHTR